MSNQITNPEPREKVTRLYLKDGKLVSIEGIYISKTSDGHLMFNQKGDIVNIPYYLRGVFAKGWTLSDAFKNDVKKRLEKAMEHELQIKELLGVQKKTKSRGMER